MKKLGKVLLGALMLSAVFVGCNNEINYEIVKFDIAAPKVVGTSEFGANLLTWEDVEYAYVYKIFRSEGDGEEKELATVTAGTEFYADKFNAGNMLKEGTAYKYRVVAARNANRAATTVGVFSENESFNSASTTVEITVKEGNAPAWGTKLPAPNITYTATEQENGVVTISFNQDSAAVEDYIYTRVWARTADWSSNFGWWHDDFVITNSGEYYVYAGNTFYNEESNAYYKKSEDVFLGKIKVEVAGENSGSWNGNSVFIPTKDANEKVTSADYAVYGEGSSAPGLTFTVARVTEDAVDNKISSSDITATIVEATASENLSSYAISFVDKNLPKLSSADGYKYTYYASAKDAKGNTYKYRLGSITDWDENYNVQSSAYISISDETVTANKFSAKLLATVSNSANANLAVTDLTLEYMLIRQVDTGKKEARLVYVGYGNGYYDYNGNWLGSYSSEENVYNEETGSYEMVTVEHKSGSYDYQDVPITYDVIDKAGKITGFTKDTAKTFELSDLTKATVYKIAYNIVANGESLGTSSGYFTTAE